jgi:hypothetical protein
MLANQFGGSTKLKSLRVKVRGALEDAVAGAEETMTQWWTGPCEWERRDFLTREAMLSLAFEYNDEFPEAGHSNGKA